MKPSIYLLTLAAFLLSCFLFVTKVQARAQLFEFSPYEFYKRAIAQKWDYKGTSMINCGLFDRRDELNEGGKFYCAQFSGWANDKLADSEKNLVWKYFGNEFPGVTFIYHGYSGYPKDGKIENASSVSFMFKFDQQFDASVTRESVLNLANNVFNVTPEVKTEERQGYQKKFYTWKSEHNKVVGKLEFGGDWQTVFTIDVQLY